MRGKWGSELLELHAINEKLESFQVDVAQIQGVSPRVFLESMSTKLIAIETKLKALGKISFFDPRKACAQSQLTAHKTVLRRLFVHLRKAEKIASDIRLACEDATEETIEMYATQGSGFSIHHAISPTERLKHTFDRKAFSNIKTSGANVWASIREQKQSCLDREGLPAVSVLALRQGYDDLLHNSLVHLLERSDAELIEAIDNGMLAIEGEIGNLIIQRLKDMRYGTSTTLTIRAGKIITKTLGNQSSDGLFKCNFDELYIELTKLALHAELHPEHKNIWLGTARMVVAEISANRGSATYLNCDDKKWTWHLNRLWLQAAVYLGFTLTLVEQHYPRVVGALLSNDGGAAFVQSLLSQVRRNPSNTSQYNGHESPTATAQEMLVALDIGCVAIQTAKDEPICFSKPVARETPCPFRTSSLKIAQCRSVVSHSWDSSCPASSSPLGKSRSQFFSPEDSRIIREQAPAPSLKFRMPREDRRLSISIDDQEDSRFCLKEATQVPNIYLSGK